MAAITFLARSILKLDGNIISEHGRQPLDVGYDQLEFARRTVNGTLRVYQIAKKQTLDVSWDLLPSRAIYTVDGFYGGNELYDIYINSGEIRVEVWTDAESVKTSSFATRDFQGRIRSFEHSIVKRNIEGKFYDFWNVTLSIEEI